MYDELVNLLRRCGEQKCKNCEYEHVIGCVTKMNEEAADAIEDLNKQIKNWEEALSKQNENWEEALKNALDFIPCWIPVTERLPEIDEKHHCSKDVLAYLKDGGMCFTALEENIFGQSCFECERNPAVEEEMIVTHWMPLPEPPKEEA